MRLAERVVVVARHQRQHLAPARQAQRVEDLRAAERLVHHLGLRRRGVVVHHVVGPQQHLRARRRRAASCRPSARRARSRAALRVQRLAPAGTRPGRRSRRRSGSPGGDRGCRRVSHCWMRPSCMMPISSAMAKASCWSCVTSTAVAPLALMMSRTSSDSRSRRSTSRLENGSSSSSSSGRGASARASATRCCWPPESSCGYLSSAAARPTSVGSSRTRAARSPPARVQPEGDVVARRADAETARSPGTPCRCAASPAAACTPRPRHHVAVEADLAFAARVSKPAMQRSTVVLPQPLGPSRQPIAPRASAKRQAAHHDLRRRRRGAGSRLRAACAIIT